jgi:hypothetical protein
MGAAIEHRPNLFLQQTRLRRNKVSIVLSGGSSFPLVMMVSRVWGGEEEEEGGWERRLKEESRVVGQKVETTVFGGGENSSGLLGQKGQRWSCSHAGPGGVKDGGNSWMWSGARISPTPGRWPQVKSTHSTGLVRTTRPDREGKRQRKGTNEAQGQASIRPATYTILAKSRVEQRKQAIEAGNRGRQASNAKPSSTTASSVHSTTSQNLR